MTAQAGSPAVRVAQPVKRRSFTRGLGVPVLTIGVLVLMLLVGLLAELLAPRSPIEVSLVNRLKPPLTPGYLLGTDALGRDILSRMVYGARISIVVAVVAVALGGAVGTILGIAAGYFGGWVDVLTMRVAEILLGFPLIIVGILLAAVFGPGLVNVLIILFLTVWPRFARIARGETLSLREKDYVAAARIVGSSPLRITWEHILPHLLSSLLILASLQAASAVVIEASLSFFGIGVPAPAPSWGGMISDGRQYVATQWWVAVMPGLAIVLLVLSLNLLGDWLRDHFDPRLRQAG